MIGAMPAVAVRHERRRQEKKVVCVNNLNTGDREGGGTSSSNTTGNRRPSLLTLQSPHSQSGTPITSPPYVQNSLPDIYVCSKVSPPDLVSPHPHNQSLSPLPHTRGCFFLSLPTGGPIMLIYMYCPRRIPCLRRCASSTTQWNLPQQTPPNGESFLWVGEDVDVLSTFIMENLRTRDAPKNSHVDGYFDFWYLSFLT